MGSGCCAQVRVCDAALWSAPGAGTVGNGEAMLSPWSCSGGAGCRGRRSPAQASFHTPLGVSGSSAQSFSLGAGGVSVATDARARLLPQVVPAPGEAHVAGS